MKIVFSILIIVYGAETWTTAKKSMSTLVTTKVNHLKSRGNHEGEYKRRNTQRKCGHGYKVYGEHVEIVQLSREENERGDITNKLIEVGSKQKKKKDLGETEETMWIR